MFDTIRWEINDGMAWLELQQPPSNKMNRIFFSELKTLVSEVIPASDFKALIIHGKGRHFSSGADIDDLLTGVRDAQDQRIPGNEPVPLFLRENNQHFVFINELKVPVIAAIQGVCLGSALELAMLCHFRICAEGALLALPEVSFNLMPGCGGTQTLPRLAGQTRGLQYLLEGKNLNAEEALLSGVVDKVVPRKALAEVCIRFAELLSADYNRNMRDYYIRRILNPLEYERK